MSIYRSEPDEDFYTPPKREPIKAVKILIDPNELQGKILNSISSEELDNWINNSVYKDNKDVRGAIIYGMTFAALQTCRCNQYVVSAEGLENFNIKI